MNIQLKCEQTCNCEKGVTHIGSKGYIYCQNHAIERRKYGYEKTRQLRTFELNKLKRGETITKY